MSNSALPFLFSMLFVYFEFVNLLELVNVQQFPIEKEILFWLFSDRQRFERLTFDL